ncbi:rho GTPase-activating protein REN1-like isoform X2 [Andrographis paniculata]|uniref:rho GTPase-activating protein REN1-like isoform X2 n=1 Tax=Andrographis paniculata TaxID=175694 RepID=UPI0021E9468E|nr:rho GTPase-activating protein REN1-like isoform X2 [Andrographis paniculata]
MTNMNAGAAPDSTQAEGNAGVNDSSPTAGPAVHGGSKVYMSGPLFLSSKGIGWTSWKKRWFILTQTSLVFYRSDPNAAPQKGGEVNLTLGGIDLNSSGSVVVKEDKKLLTVAFSDGRDGRSFTLKAETLEDLYKWKTALEEALANAPSASPVAGQNGASKNENFNSDDVSSEQSKDKEPAKSLVLGRPILLALEDTDGTPSFLEKALRFVEEHGVKTEGILRQAADVELVERRILEYEKGKNDFSPNEDAHVIGDCIKYILRELPSSPVPASCCKALVEAYRTERSKRVDAMQSAICETFPEPNRRLLQRILEMCIVVASNKAVNRMSVSAVAACMAPLLLRPLLAGECDIDNHIDMGGDSSAQLLQAAAAANHAQAIVITLIDEYDNIFGDGAETHEPYTDSDESDMESDEITDDESYEDEDEDEDDYVTEGSDYEDEDDEEDEEEESRASESARSNCNSPNQNSSSPDRAKLQSNNSSDLTEDDPSEASLVQVSSELSHGSSRSARQRQVLGRATGKKNLSGESGEVSHDDEAEWHAKMDLHIGTPNEATVKALLQDIVDKRKNDLHERRLYLEKDVVRLQELLRKEMELRATIDAGLKSSQLPSSVSSLISEKMKAELEDITRAEADVMILKRKADDLESQLYEQREQNSRVWHDQQKLKVKHRDGASKISTSKDDSPSSSNMALVPQTDNPKLLSVISMATSMDSGANKFGPTASRKPGMPPGASANSALSKLTNRLNFLKERRAQIANELQNLNIGRSLSRSGESRKISTSFENPQSPDKNQESKGWPSEKGQEPENREAQTNPNSQAGKKSKKPQSLDKGNSESLPYGGDKGTSKNTSRTFSR